MEVGSKCREVEPELLVNGSVVKTVTTLKYLGHFLYDDLKDHLATEGMYGLTF